MPAGDVNLAATYRTIDSFGDGIPDSWRAEHFDGDGTSTTANSLAAADPDGDGANNLEEYESGTDPNNPNSVFK